MYETAGAKIDSKKNMEVPYQKIEWMDLYDENDSFDVKRKEQYQLQLVPNLNSKTRMTPRFFEDIIFDLVPVVRRSDAEHMMLAY